MNQTTTTTDAPALAGWMQEAAEAIASTQSGVGTPEEILAIIAQHAPARAIPCDMTEQEIENEVFKYYVRHGTDAKTARDYADRAIHIGTRSQGRK